MAIDVLKNYPPSNPFRVNETLNNSIPVREDVSICKRNMEQTRKKEQIVYKSSEQVLKDCQSLFRLKEYQLMRNLIWTYAHAILCPEKEKESEMDESANNDNGDDKKHFKSSDDQNAIKNSLIHIWDQSLFNEFRELNNMKMDIDEQGGKGMLQLRNDVDKFSDELKSQIVKKNPCPIVPSNEYEEDDGEISSHLSTVTSSNHFDDVSVGGGDTVRCEVDGGASTGNLFRVKNARLSKVVHDGLNDWLKTHTKNPYPNRAEKEQLSVQLGITPQQVNRWFIQRRKMLRVRGHLYLGRQYEHENSNKQQFQNLTQDEQPDSTDDKRRDDNMPSDQQCVEVMKHENRELSPKSHDIIGQMESDGTCGEDQDDGHGDEEEDIDHMIGDHIDDPSILTPPLSVGGQTNYLDDCSTPIFNNHPSTVVRHTPFIFNNPNTSITVTKDFHRNGPSPPHFPSFSPHMLSCSPLHHLPATVPPQPSFVPTISFNTLQPIPMEKTTASTYPSFDGATDLRIVRGRSGDDDHNNEKNRLHHILPILSPPPISSPSVLNCPLDLSWKSSSPNIPFHDQTRLSMKMEDEEVNTTTSLQQAEQVAVNALLSLSGRAKERRLHTTRQYE